MGRRPKARMVEIELIGVTNCTVKFGGKLIAKGTQVHGETAYELLGRGHADMKFDHILDSIREDVKTRDANRVAREKRARAKAKVELRAQRDANIKAEKPDYKGALQRALEEGVTNA